MMKATRVPILLAGLASCFCFGLGFPVYEESRQADDNDNLCTICLDGAKLFQQAVESNLTLDTIYPVVHDLCLEALQSGGRYTCPGFIYSYGPVILYVLSHVFIEPRVICEDLNFCKPSSLTATTHVSSETGSALYKRLREESNKLQDLKWDTLKENLSKARERLLSNKFHLPHDESQKDNDWMEKSMSDNNRSGPLKHKRMPKNGVIRFLQLADIHLDHEYDEGSPSDCGLYLCCRHWYNGTERAGHYGAYNCDLPQPTLDLLVDTLQKLDPQPDFIVYTGDNAPHDVWNETWSTQLKATEFIVNYLSDKLPNVTIYPAIGNHESWPESEYIGTMIQYQALTQNLAGYWKSWVDFPQEALDTIARGAYYNVRIMDNLRVISFNSDYGYSLNFYSYLNSINDHYKAQQHWIERQLHRAKEEGDKVLLIAHIPPGDTDNHAEYGEFYLNITRRYSDIIVGHLFGHTHTDEFQLVQDENGVYGVVLIAPSVTPYGHINPSFRVFTMNAASKKLLGYEQYFLNLTHANEVHTRGDGTNPQFQLSYTTVDEYGLKDLSPEEWTSVVSRFESEASLLDKYSFNIHSKSMPPDKTCDQSCKKHILCSVTNVISSQYLTCHEN